MRYFEIEFGNSAYACIAADKLPTPADVVTRYDIPELIFGPVTSIHEITRAAATATYDEIYEEEKTE